MEWLRTHPYTSALCAAGVLLLLGAFVVQSRATLPAETRPTAWGGGAAPLLNPTSYEAAQNTSRGEESILQQVTDGPPYTYTPPAGIVPPTTTNEGPYDFETFIALLSAQGRPTSGGMQSASTSIDAYAYLPSGLISTTTPDTGRTSLQQTLYDYGNEIGSSIESFEQQHLDTVQILKGQVEDRSNPDKAQAVVNIGRAFQILGNGLAAMDTVPPAMSSAHKALAQSYIEIGKNLSLIPSAERDSDFIKAIQTYNASADTFTKNYIQIVSLFGAYGVTFTSVDAGRVFTFSPTGF